MNKKYPSKYSNNKVVSAAQYITEIICEKKAMREKEDLHYRFWLNKKWASYYRNQIATANDLLRKYPENAVVKALNAKESQNIYSLRAPHLKAIIEKYVKIIEKENKDLRIDFTRKEDAKFVRKDLSKKKSLFSKLEDIDNDI
jgi:hypothetical protein